ncbi:voltage-gated sodium channel [Natronospira proteinivora]|uniref:Voltage-gated sodium channel n=1 Tax=Natronospira proteinivora TaxID=1807133 RepID=A0ABT1GB76_9GAMM|nr:ion transporter [Natronospira proteinivora]MCP1728544.1 voltage-gated sodium channel [Natronospira proteinivora]
MAARGETNPSWREVLGNWIESPWPRNFIVALILINAVILGLQTSPEARAVAGDWMIWINRVIVAVFVLEVGGKLLAWGPRFFRDGWNVFDFLIVAISLVPDSAGLSVLRALRILRVLRLLSTVKHLRVVTESLLKAIPGIGWIGLLLLIVFYVFGVMGTELFAEDFPRQFGHVGASMYSLFQIMTLEGWSEDIARPVMEVYPFAWVYFIVFILMSSFTVLNLFIGIIVNSMQELHWTEEEAKQAERDEKAHRERERMMHLIEELHSKVDRLERRQ